MINKSSNAKSNLFFIGGTFGETEGKKSSIVEKLKTKLDCDGINGGTLKDLLELDFTSFDSLIWMPNIDNSVDKILPNIKSSNPHLLLISSKRVVEKDYKESDVIGRLLKTRSNLGIMIEKKQDLYSFKLLDPLGNMFCNTTNINILATTIINRVNYLKGLTRMASTPTEDNSLPVVDPNFIELVKSFGLEFSKFVNAVNPNRLLGNAASRCSYGFPAIRLNDHILVTRRNVDKKTLTENDFVKVCEVDGKINYSGDYKPSVDTPIQVRLFDTYPNINYMVHGHVYIENAPFTESVIPCGYLEEFQDILKIIPNKETSKFIVNLRGHGCLIAGANLSDFDEVKFIGRNCPEIQCRSS